MASLRSLSRLQRFAVFSSWVLLVLIRGSLSASLRTVALLIPTGMLLTLRSLLATIVLLLVLLFVVMRQRRRFARIERETGQAPKPFERGPNIFDNWAIHKRRVRTWIGVLYMGLFQNLAIFFLLTFGEQRVNAVIPGALIALAPVLSFFFSLMFAKCRYRFQAPASKPLIIVGVLLAVTAIGMCLGSDINDLDDFDDSYPYYICVFLAVILWGFNLVLFGQLSVDAKSKTKLHPVLSNLGQNLFGAVFALILSLAVDFNFPGFYGARFNGEDHFSFFAGVFASPDTGLVVYGILFMGIVSGVVGQGLMFFLAHTVDPDFAQTNVMLVPCLSTLEGVLILNEWDGKSDTFKLVYSGGLALLFVGGILFALGKSLNKPIQPAAAKAPPINDGTRPRPLSGRDMFMDSQNTPTEADIGTGLTMRLLPTSTDTP